MLDFVTGIGDRSELPATPLHYPVAYITSKVDDRLSLSGLIVGNMTPDLEIPIFYYITRSHIYDRLVLHSVLGAATLGTLLSIGITVFLYPWIVSHFLKLDINEVKKRCRFSSWLILSCLIGNLSHVFLDVTNHEYNPLLWPFLSTDNAFNIICPLLGGANHASAIIHAIMMVSLIAILVHAGAHKSWEQLLKGFWKQLLVGGK